MTYDEHYEGGAAGPVAGIQFVEDSIQYALSKNYCRQNCDRRSFIWTRMEFR